MKEDFSHVTILGGGLLGGSLYLALSGLQNRPQVKLWARREETAREAPSHGIHNVTTDLHEAVKEADLVVLSVPVGAMPGLVKSALKVGLPPRCVITDVGSVKTAPHQQIAPLLSGTGCHFIGSHPMAGSEKNGVSAVDRHLFKNAPCLLTNDGGAPEHQTAALERFWSAVGCKTSWMTATSHDALVARISHLPHILAVTGATVCLKNPGDGDFGGGGLRDTTRVAGGNPSMWAEILMENRHALIPPLKETLEDLRGVLDCLERGDHEEILHWLDAAKRLRSSLPSSR